MSKQDLFATPALWYPGQTVAESEHQVALMVDRAWYTHQFLQGEMSPADFLEMLDQYHVDPIQAVDDWDDGLIYV